MHWGVTSLDRNYRMKDPSSRPLKKRTFILKQFKKCSPSLDGASTREDRHRLNIVAVFDDLKDYLSESDLDLSLDYKIALKRRKNKLDFAKQANEEIKPGGGWHLFIQLSIKWKHLFNSWCQLSLSHTFMSRVIKSYLQEVVTLPRHESRTAPKF